MQRLMIIPNSIRYYQITMENFKKSLRVRWLNSMGEELVEEQRHGSPIFYKLLEEMAETHDQKSHDYASNTNPYGNYEFAGQVAVMFSHSPQDAGFVGRLAEKIYRLANLEGSGKIAKNESIEDTERDIAVITALWMASRRERRTKSPVKFQEQLEVAVIKAESEMDDLTVDRCLSYLQASKEARMRKT